MVARYRPGPTPPTDARALVEQMQLSDEEIARRKEFVSVQARQETPLRWACPTPATHYNVGAGSRSGAVRIGWLRPRSSGAAHLLGVGFGLLAHVEPLANVEVDLHPRRRAVGRAPRPILLGRRNPGRVSPCGSQPSLPTWSARSHDNPAVWRNHSSS